jgi:hypothetical protein
LPTRPGGPAEILAPSKVRVVSEPSGQPFLAAGRSAHDKCYGRNYWFR